jgi:putative FmdB family regulatory protein
MPVPSQKSSVSPTRKRLRVRDGPRAATSITGSFSALSKPITLLASLIGVPTYEYKCPNGHVFEVFKRIADPPPEACPICGASPVQTVLYPVPVHFRGSGFYSTDYGRGGRKKEPAKESGDSGGDEKKKDTSTEKKAAEA